ncbi:alpha-1,2-fucosyltransferase [Runella sp.]|uniref:alpha-1,2-fucosyltransferase n=1 Tax=Runella sp. TaxID=1960881 RepID=UPI003D09EFB2
MIIVKLSGGLGNQLFQYALGRHLAIINQTKLKLDTSLLAQTSDWTSRNFALSAFTIQAEQATKEEIQTLAGSPHHFLQRMGRKLGIKPARYFKEPYFHFYSPVLSIKSSHYLDGYWQSEKYFKAISSLIRQEFSLKLPLSSHSQRFKEKVAGCSSVSIHIRRGDYAKTSKANRYLKPLEMDYYQRAIKHITHQVPNPHFFIFSDDIEWVKDQLIAPFPMHFSEGNSAHEDLWLMAHCRHHIIANSTFSWWGAWLNPRPDKIVIAPQKWFSTERFNTQNLLPEAWIGL